MEKWNKLKEGEAIEVMELSNHDFIFNDDKMLLRAMKTDSTTLKAFPLEKYYRGKMNRGKIDKYQVENRKDKSTEWVKAKDYDKENWKIISTSYEWWLRLNNESDLMIKGNEIVLIIRGLYQDLSSRYKIALDKMIEMLDSSIIEYKPRVSNPSLKNIKESLRQTLKRNFKVAEYEHNTLFKGELAGVVFAESKRIGSALEDNQDTFYIDGLFNKAGEPIKRPSKTVKVYKPQLREGKEFDQVEAVKLEITLRQGSLKTAGARNPQDFLTQPEIQQKISKVLIASLSKFIKQWEKESLTMLAQSMKTGTRNPQELSKRMIRDKDKTLTQRVASIETRMSAVEKGQTEINQKLKDLKEQGKLF